MKDIESVKISGYTTKLGLFFGMCLACAPEKCLACAPGNRLACAPENFHFYLYLHLSFYFHFYFDFHVYIYHHLYLYFYFYLQSHFYSYIYFYLQSHFYSYLQHAASPRPLKLKNNIFHTTEKNGTKKYSP